MLSFYAQKNRLLAKTREILQFGFNQYDRRSVDWINNRKPNISPR